LGVDAKFVIGLHLVDLPLLFQIQNFFGGIGKITTCGNVAKFTVGRLEDLVTVIIPHFQAYPLITQKSIDFQIFSFVVDLMGQALHLTDKGLNLIVAAKSAMNKGLPENLKAVFPNVTPLPRALASTATLLDPNWVSGFTCGEGWFSTATHRDSFQVTFGLTQHERDHPLLLKFEDFFGCGGCSITSKLNTYEYRVRSFKKCFDHILPHFDQYPVLGRKQRNYELWREVVTVLNSGAHKTEEGRARIIEIRSLLNKYPKPQTP
jgi:hypothetical protein